MTQATGTIDSIYQEQVVSGTFRKREFVLMIADKPEYPQYVKFEFIQDKCDLLNNFQIGQSVTIDFNLNGRKWLDPKDGKEKVFNCLQSWKISSDQQSQPSQQQSYSPPPPPQTNTGPAQYQEPNNNQLEDD